MRNSQKIMFFASFILIIVFFIPVWQVTLSAPQYPDPIGMNIWIYKITDMNPNDLKNINLMNHYIGMDPIPEFIPEFKYFPYILSFVIFIGLVFSFIKKHTLYIFWFLIISCLGLLGMYDFWLWEYDYGHNLDPNAAIKFFDELGNPMNYQPPLIGSKMVLNFNATSMPLFGGYLIFLSTFLSLFAFFLGEKESKLGYSSKIKSSKFNYALTFLIIFLSSCESKPRDIKYGYDECVFCKMRVMDKQHAAEIVTVKGKVLIFDSIECMLKSIKEIDENEINFVLTNVYEEPSILHNAFESTYIISVDILSPMGMNLTAFKSEDSAVNFVNNNSGEVYNWKEISSLNLH